MKKLSVVLLSVALLALVTSTRAQNDSDQFARHFKKYVLPPTGIKEHWIISSIGFSDRCDTITFQGKLMNVTEFTSALGVFITNQTDRDTIVLQLDYGNDVSFDEVNCSCTLLSSRIEKSEGHGVYYFSAIRKTASKQVDTIDLHTGHMLEYNGKALAYESLANQLQKLKPETVMLRADPEVPIQDLADIMAIAQKKGVKVVLGRR